MRAVRLAIRRARELTSNPGQLEALATLAADNEAFAQLDKLIRQRDVQGARELMQTLTISIATDSPVYPALQSRRQLLERLEGNPRAAFFQAASSP